MIKIIVADDEENVRDIVARYIDHHGDDYTVTGCAENGKKAWEMIGEMHPDIVISDICMPVMDGLELIQKLKEENFPGKVIIISGYNEFEYAKKAISLGVSEYLLKPFMPDELMEILDKLKNELEDQGILEKNLKEMRDELEENKRNRQRDYISKVIGGDGGDLELEDQGMQLEADMYCVSVVRAYGRTNAGVTTFLQLFEQLFMNFKDSYFDRNVHAFLSQPKNKDIHILFTGNFQNEVSFRKKIQEGLEKICRGGERYYGIGLQCTIGDIVYDFGQIPVSCAQAVTIWNGLLDNSEEILFYKDYAVKNSRLNITKDRTRPEAEEKALLLEIQMSRREDALDTLDSIFDFYSSYSVDMAGFVKLSLIELLLAVQQLLCTSGSEYNIWSENQLLSSVTESFQQSSLKEIKDIFCGCIDECCREFDKMNERQSDKIVFAVKEMIEKNIGNDDFSLDMISKELFFSIHYIRQVFKQLTNENIQEYLIRRRMERAGELLKEHGYKVTEVAEMTGYKNQRYFATTFRRYYGCTPTEYKLK